jgi:uncharacterized protein (TIGR03435 family)
VLGQAVPAAPAAARAVTNCRSEVRLAHVDRDGMHVLPNHKPSVGHRRRRCGGSSLASAGAGDGKSFVTVWVQRAIVDKTGFSGTFDVDLKWNPNETAVGNVAPISPSDAAPSIFTALEEQLGLNSSRNEGLLKVW